MTECITPHESHGTDLDRVAGLDNLLEEALAARAGRGRQTDNISMGWRNTLDRPSGRNTRDYVSHWFPTWGRGPLVVRKS